MVYLKRFENGQEYWDYAVSKDFVAPNVSDVKDPTGDVPVHYNNYCWKCEYDVPSAGTPTNIIFNPSFSQFRVDGVMVPLKSRTYTFDEAGHHDIIFVCKPGDEHYIYDSTFAQASALTAVTIPPFVDEVQYGVFAYTGLKKIVIPGTVKTLCTRPAGKTGEGLTCYNCTALTEAIIEEGIKILPMAMFYNCNVLENVVLPDSLEEIHDRCFMCTGANTGLKSLRLGKNLKKMEGGIFRYCVYLKELIMECEQVPTIASNTFQSSYFGGFTDPEDESEWAKIYVPDDMYDAYLAAPVWSGLTKYLKKMSERPVE